MAEHDYTTQEILNKTFNSTTNQLQTNASSTGGGGTGAIIDGVDSNIKATVKDFTNSNPLAVEIVDANGDQITSFGSATVTVNNSTGASAVNVQDGGNTLTVDGAVTVTNSTATSLKAEAIGTKTNNAAVPGATNLGTLQGIANAAAPTWTETYMVAESMDLSGNQRVTAGTLGAGENLTTNRLNNEEVYLYASITTQTTTVVKNAAGTLAGFLIPTPLASATIKVYDNGAASGSVMVDTITFPAALLSSGPVFVKVNTSFAIGCTVVTAGATMAVDVYYR